MLYGRCFLGNHPKIHLEKLYRDRFSFTIILAVKLVIKSKEKQAGKCIEQYKTCSQICPYSICPALYFCAPYNFLLRYKAVL